MGGVLFIDEAYYLYKPDNERDYGSEAIEILLQVMENQRDDLVVILAGYKEPMDCFYESNPGLSSRIANHIDFPDYTVEELLKIAGIKQAVIVPKIDSKFGQRPVAFLDTDNPFSAKTFVIAAVNVVLPWST